MMPKLPVVSLRQKLLAKIQRHIVFHQDRLGGRAVGGILRHLRELELRHAWLPLANRLAQRGVEDREALVADALGFIAANYEQPQPHKLAK